MSYQELVNECKKSYAECSLNGAYHYWEEIHNLLLSKLNKCSSEDERHAMYSEFHNYMQQFTDDEVYDITDYGKAKAERMREREVLASMNYKNLYALTKDERMKALDDFLEFYEWGIVASDDTKDMYCIYDIQTNEYIDADENNSNKTLEEVIDRIVGRVIDYEQNEREFDDDYVDDDTIKYLEDLYEVGKQYTKEDKYTKNWLQQFRDFIDELKGEM